MKSKILALSSKPVMQIVGETLPEKWTLDDYIHSRRDKYEFLDRLIPGTWYRIKDIPEDFRKEVIEILTNGTIPYPFRDNKFEINKMPGSYQVIEDKDFTNFKIEK